MFSNGRQCVLLIGCQLGLLFASAGVSKEVPVEFNRDIRPILADNCYACHGPDENQRQADLRLDVQAEVFADRGGYSVIVPGKPGLSELLQRITSTDPDEVMPPADHRKKLTESEKQLLKRWVEEGAKWQTHWAWRPAKRTTIANSSNKTGNYIDQQIGARLAAAGLDSAPPADKIVLLRRLYFDLIGLPPTPEQVDAYLADQSPDAYEKQVDQLLASPHYGERMAIFWLDQVRYADTVGYHGDQDVSVSPYRDYVIDSFNSNRSFDQFTREQIAGDLLPSATLEQRIASGYNRLGMMSAEGGVQPEEYLTKYAADRVRTTASVWLGVTLGCAECHDHKFDPFTAKDFYSFAAFFADIKERGLYSGANTSGVWGPQIDVHDEQLPGLVEPIDQQIGALKDSMLSQVPSQTELAGLNQQQLTAKQPKSPDPKPVAPAAATTSHWPRLIAAVDPGSQNEAWAKPAMDHSQWKTMQLPGHFDTAELPGFDGVVWFRKTIELTEKQAQASAVLHLGQIDDMDVSWVNGTRVGGYEDPGHHDTLRRYTVPPGVLQAGKNVIAVRVMDHGAPGGIAGKPEQLALQLGDETLSLANQWHLAPGASLAVLNQHAVLESEQVQWESDIRSKVFAWDRQRPVDVRTYHQTAHQVLDDESVLMTGPVTDEDCYLLTLQLPAGTHRALRLEVLPDKKLPNQGPGRAGNGNFVITQLRVVQGDHRERMEELKKVVDSWPEELAEVDLELVNATATFEQADNGANPYKKWSAASAIDRDKHGPTFGWAVMPQNGQKNEWVAQFAQPLELSEPETLTIVLHQYHGAGNHVLGRFRISSTANADATADPFKSLPAKVKQLVGIDPADRTDSQKQVVKDYYFSIAPALEPIRQQIAELEKQREQITKAHTRTSLVTVAVPPREMRVLPRGNWMDKTGDVVVPEIPALFGSLENPDGRRLNRLDLANWIVSADNPLTARVFVNRLWKLYFGTGLSKVLDDLGAQGEAPSHPELLDMLAQDFVDSDWDVKAIVRKLVTSQTYRQSSAERTELLEVDPYNRLLARQSRYRLEAELIRDNALSVSGLLVTEIGGRSAKPYQPAGLYRHLNFPARKYVADEGENQFRRGLYTHWQRQFLHPAMKAFDAPSREECSCERPRSNTPVGALVMLNDPSFVEAARNLAELTMRDTATDVGSRVDMMFRRALSRNPSPRERKVMTGLFQAHLTHFQANPAQAELIVQTGISEVPADLSKSELAAWTSVGRTVMNLHEFVTRN